MSYPSGNLNLVAELGQLWNLVYRCHLPTTTQLFVHLLYLTTTIVLIRIACIALPILATSTPSPPNLPPPSANPTKHLHYLLHLLAHFVTATFCYCYMLNPQAQQSNSADKYNTSIGLQEYNPHTPPGWKPGLKNYPFRKYIQKMQLWNAIKACTNDQVGPLVAGRLCGSAFQIAMHLRITRSTGDVLLGPESSSSTRHISSNQLRKQRRPIRRTNTAQQVDR